MAWDDVLADLANIDDEKLTTAHGEIVGRINELRPKAKDRTLTDDELTELQGLSETYQQVNGQVTERQQRRDEAYNAADAALADIPDPAAETEEPAEAEGAEGEEPERKPQPSDTPAEGAEQATQPVAASGGAKVPPLGRTGRAAPRQAKPPAPVVQIGITAGGEKIEFDQIGDRISTRLGRLEKNYAADGEQLTVVQLRASGVPEDRRLKRSEAAQNTIKLDKVASETAIVAAGGLCAPLAIDYSYETIGVQGRPIRDSLPGFQAERGGIQFRPNVSPVTNTAANGPRSATGHWTMADDVAAADPAGTGYKRKALWVVDCPATTTAEVEAITLQTEWSNVTSRFDPETVQANQAAALIWHDRHCENWLWGKLAALSKVMTSAQVLGATRDVLVTLDRAQAYLRSVHRLSANLPLRAILPSWVRHLLRADLARAMSLTPTEALGITDDQIDGFLRTRSLNPVWHLDGKDSTTAAVTGPPAIPEVPAQQYLLASPGTAVPNFPTKIDMLLHPEGHFQHLDGGTLDIGIVRDSDLIERNRYREFTETWEGVAARGVEALRLIATVAPTGESAGTIDVATAA